MSLEPTPDPVEPAPVHADQTQVPSEPIPASGQPSLETMEIVFIDDDGIEVGFKLREQDNYRRLWFEAGKCVPAFLEGL